MHTDQDRARQDRVRDTLRTRARMEGERDGGWIDIAELGQVAWVSRPHSTVAQLSVVGAVEIRYTRGRPEVRLSPRS